MLEGVDHVSGLASMEDVLQFQLTVLQKRRSTRIVIVMIGQTGSGKSTLGNLLLGETVNEGPFRTSASPRACTAKVSFVDGNFLGIEGRPIRVVDTPGSSDTEGRDAEFRKQFVEHLASLRRIHVILWVRNSNCKIDINEKQYIRIMAELFGPCILENSVLNFTDYHFDQKSIERRKRTRHSLQSIAAAFWNQLLSCTDLVDDEELEQIPVFALDAMYNSTDEKEGTYFKKNASGMWEAFKQNAVRPIRELKYLSARLQEVEDQYRNAQEILRQKNQELEELERKLARTRNFLNTTDDEKVIVLHQEKPKEQNEINSATGSKRGGWVLAVAKKFHEQIIKDKPELPPRPAKGRHTAVPGQQTLSRTTSFPNLNEATNQTQEKDLPPPSQELAPISPSFSASNIVKKSSTDPEEKEVTEEKPEITEEKSEVAKEDESIPPPAYPAPVPGLDSLTSFPVEKPTTLPRTRKYEQPKFYVPRSPTEESEELETKTKVESKAVVEPDQISPGDASDTEKKIEKVEEERQIVIEVLKDIKQEQDELLDNKERVEAPPKPGFLGKLKKWFVAPVTKKETKKI